MGGAEPVSGHADARCLITKPWHGSFADIAALDLIQALLTVLVQVLLTVLV